MMDKAACSDLIADHVLNSFFPFFSLRPEEVCLIGTEKHPLPSFSHQQIEMFISKVHKSILDAKMFSLMKVDMSANKGPVYVIGDIHGNFHDLLRILLSIDNFLTERIVFLGDYVDRGNFSLEVVLLLFSLFVKYPNQFYLIRGNHEFKNVNGVYGFKAEISERFGSESLWEMINNEIFDYLPFAVLLGDNTLCLHGGLGPNVTTLKSIEQIEIPFTKGYNLEDKHDKLDKADKHDKHDKHDRHENDDKCDKARDVEEKINKYLDRGKEYFENIVAEIVWSDPSTEFVTFMNSTRGTGVLFGRLALHNFLKSNNLKTLIRGHQCVRYGINNMDNSCVTVFSCSNYSGRNNSAGFIMVCPDDEIKQEILEPIKFIERRDARFGEVTEIKKKRDQNRSICFSLLTKSISTKGRRGSYMNPQNAKQCTLCSGSFVCAKIAKPYVGKIPSKSPSFITEMCEFLEK